MKVTRRGLARTLAAAAAIQRVATAQAPPAAASSDDDLKSARDRSSANAKQLAAVRVPMTVEPAFRFRA